MSFLRRAGLSAGRYDAKLCTSRAFQRRYAPLDLRIEGHSLLCLAMLPLLQHLQPSHIKLRNSQQCPNQSVQESHFSLRPKTSAFGRTVIVQTLSKSFVHPAFHGMLPGHGAFMAKAHLAENRKHSLARKIRVCLKREVLKRRMGKMKHDQKGLWFLGLQQRLGPAHVRTFTMIMLPATSRPQAKAMSCPTTNRCTCQTHNVEIGKAMSRSM